jgi:hypothetical protein
MVLLPGSPFAQGKQLPPIEVDLTALALQLLDSVVDSEQDIEMFKYYTGPETLTALLLHTNDLNSLNACLQLLVTIFIRGTVYLSVSSLILTDWTIQTAVPLPFSLKTAALKRCWPFSLPLTCRACNSAFVHFQVCSLPPVCIV